MEPLPEKVNVLVLHWLGEGPLERIRAVAPDRLNVVSAISDFVEELSREWPAELLQRYRLRLDMERKHTDAEREALVRDAHVIFMTQPFPKTLVQRAPNLRWAHFSFAGVSNLMNTPWWGAPIDVTSSRGYTSVRPIAENVIGATFMFARRLDWAVDETRAHRFDPTSHPGARLVRDKTMAIVGLGGIGSEVAKLAKGVGMRVIATRGSATQRQENVDGVDVVFPASQLHDMLAEADFVAVCAAWTPETEAMLDAAAFTALKPGAYLMNVSRGEIIDEPAMVEALRDGRLAGAYLDVWKDDFGSPPSADLQALPNVIFTPHVAGRSDGATVLTVDLFCKNLDRFLKGEPLENLVDWERGY
ncbi:MAG TPA: D-2-hydroxyacid dehydrogenase [Dehalococcoidia bacterium]|nr:D-2-hydroxyacid dehydrogenase [Dehalococcoidia bacterium]